MNCPKCAKVILNPGSMTTHIKWCGLGPHELFWTKVDKNGPGGCWIWTASRKPMGYGHMRLRNKDYNAHRVSYEIANGPIPAGMSVMHTCDVTCCVNPAHLKLGTHQANMTDCKEKRRHSHGERSNRNKLTEEQVRQIKRDHRFVHRTNNNTKELAEKYGVTAGTIGRIIYRDGWSHVE